MDLVEELTKKLEKIENAIIAQEGLRGVFPEEQVERSLFTLRQEKQAILLQLEDAGTKIEGDVDSGGGAVIPGVVKTEGGDFTGRDRNTNIYNGIYNGMAPKTDEEALAIYRAVVADRCSHLPLRGLSKHSSDATSTRKTLSLPGVYINLNTEQSVDPERVAKAIRGEIEDWRSPPVERGEAREMTGTKRKPLSALAAVILTQNLVLLGDPGSGKTTFLNHLAFSLAKESWKQIPDWPEPERDILPVAITLRDFAYWIAGLEKTRQASAGLLWDYLQYDLEKSNLSFVAPCLENAFQNGRAMLLLDGLDEVPPGQESRGLIIKTVTEFQKRYDTSRYLVTCRVLSYQDPAWQLPENKNTSFQLADFNDEQIQAFIQAWHTEIAAKWNKPQSAVGILEKKLQSEITERSDLRRLAPNPLLLTVMALVHTSDGELPESRALLYSRAVDILLWRWEQEKTKEYGEESEILRLLRQAQRTRGDLLVLLAEIAFSAHAQLKPDDDREKVTGVPEMGLIKALCQLHPKESYDWAKQVVDAMRLRAGLLVERTGGVFAFPHRTFQEYLAGVHLSRQSDFTEKAVEYFQQGDFWRIVILLAVGHMVHSNQEYEKPRLLIEELDPPDPNNTSQAWHQIWLAGEVFLELGVVRAKDTSHGRRLLKRTRKHLAKAVGEVHLLPEERLKTGDVLGQLGDPRLGVGVVDFQDTIVPDIDWVEIPSGAFTMGSPEDEEDAWEDEKPAHKVHLAQYYIGRYPITNAQYRPFWEGGGYEEQRYWTEEGWAWRQGAPADLSPIDDKDLKKRYQDWLANRPQEKRDRPYWWDDPKWGGVNRPVVGVSWYEALAYCTWLNEKLKKWAEEKLKGAELQSDQRSLWEKLAHGEKIVRLPTEAEWEKAARGERRCRWPWGNEWAEGHANTKEANLEETNPVGIFPLGASPYGLLDMAGNVWEWTISRWGRKSIYKPDYGYPYQSNDGRERLGGPDFRVLRGGSWRGDSGTLAAPPAAGAPLITSNLYDYVGFRVVVSLAISDF